MNDRPPYWSVADDLLSVSLDEEDTAYPWDLADPDPEGSFSLLDVVSDEELDRRSGAFHAALQQRWDEIDRLSPFARFSALLPSEFLTRLVESAGEALDRPIEALERLVACIQPLFPHRSPDDLQVFARPYALAMRDPTANAIDTSRDWETLCESERIRRSLAIAGEILARLAPGRGKRE